MRESLFILTPARRFYIFVVIPIMSKRRASAVSLSKAPPAKRSRTTARHSYVWSDFAACSGLFEHFVCAYLDPVSQRALLCASKHEAQRVTPHLRCYAYQVYFIQQQLDRALYIAILYDHVGLFLMRRPYGDNYDRAISGCRAINIALALLEMPLHERRCDLVDALPSFLWSLANVIGPIHVDAWAMLVALRGGLMCCWEWLRDWIHETRRDEANVAMILCALSFYAPPQITAAFASFITGGCDQYNRDILTGVLDNLLARRNNLHLLF